MMNELDEAIRIARGAGLILLDHFSRAPNVQWKAPGDPVTSADHAASEHIVEEISRLFPEDGVLSEELPPTPARLERECVWIIDPMDGTREFIGHGEDFAVMIGMTVAGVPVLGVVYQPITDKLYYGAKDHGAFLEKTGPAIPLHVSTESVAAKMTMAVSRSHRSARVDEIRERLRIPHAIRLGSVGLKVGLLCEGRAHLYIHPTGRTHIWDTCAPDAILEAAGGRLTDTQGNLLEYRSNEVKNLRGLIASNGLVHDRAVTITQAVLAAWDSSPPRP